MPSSESECTIAQLFGGRSTRAMFSWMPSKPSILKPHQSAHSARAHALGGQPVGDLVGLDAVVEGGDLEAELLRQIEHHRHLVGAIAVDVDEDVAVDRAGQRVELEVALAARVLVRSGFAAASLRFFMYSAASTKAAR